MSFKKTFEIVARNANLLLDNAFRLRYKYNIYRTTDLAEARRYDPLQLHWISPDALTREIPGRAFRKRHTPGVVIGGDWDRNTIDYHREHFRGFQQRFIEGRPWEETVLYRDAIDRPSDNLWHGCKTKREVIGRLQQYDLIYESIAKNGYQTQRKLAERAEKVSYWNIRLSPPELKEIIVHIDRDGNYIFDDGRHRLAIAKILGLINIPVLVMARHRQWYAVSNG
jgi:hypothetical protein